MGIFGGKRARATAVAPEPSMHLLSPMWRAESGLLTWPSGVVDDDGCASADAYGIRFLLDGNREVSLIVWAYPCYAAGDDDDLFDPGYCTVYQAGEWTWRHYAAGPGWSQGLDDGILAARRLAEDLAGTAHPVYGPDAEALGFDWDGTPW